LKNTDKKTVESFGEEWSRFDQSALNDNDSDKIFNKYFSIFPWEKISKNSEGFDMGCGTGRWAAKVAPKVKLLNCIDPSNAIFIAKKILKNHKNIIFLHEAANSNGLKEASQDFGYSLGVLHHIPDTQNALNASVRLLKPGAPFLVYIYYSFDNRSKFYKYIWKCSDFVRKYICSLPPLMKNFCTDLIAIFVYFPLAKFSNLLEKIGLEVKNIPLSFYRNKSFYVMKTDSRDRFGTPLEKRFTKKQIYSMMIDSGLEKITFSDTAPFWCSVGYKKITNKK
jgi:ubiquinone/menaquinone biosynthesis C-methylase UbiE